MVSYCAHAPSTAPNINFDQSRVRGARAQETTSPLSLCQSPTISLYLFLLSFNGTAPAIAYHRAH
jgi:hypothetical protein